MIIMMMIHAYGMAASANGIFKNRVPDTATLTL
jgi:hypothetical protein